MIASAAAAGQTLGIVGGGTRSGLGRRSVADATLTSAKLKGISFYEPAELVLGARAGTPLREIEAALSENGQSLAFEPMDHRPLYGTIGDPTIGAIASANISGPRRIMVGAARDALLGVRLINGSGEIIKSGGRVMKNVTGLDLVKLVCGAYGTLGFLTEVVFKVLPKPERAATLLLEGLSDADAIAALSAALGSPYEPSGAAHLPAGVGQNASRTLVRVEGFSDSVDHRLEALRLLLAGWSSTEPIEGDASARIWTDIRDVRFLAEPSERTIWRLSTPPTKAPSVAASIVDELPDAKWLYDLGGGLIWLSVEAAGDAGAAVIRQTLSATSGNATLLRAPDEIRQAVPVFQPLAGPLMRLTEGIKRSFDPSSILEPGRMYAGL